MHPESLQALSALLTHARSGTITAPAQRTVAIKASSAGMEACQFVAIALLRVAMTAYENVVGPLVKAWAKSKCAVLH